MASLRDRKRERTRQALVDAATELFERNGYDRTTVADIAAAADVATRTFFSYFASKEELLFPEADVRVRATMAAIAAKGPGDSPADVLLKALDDVNEASDDMVSRLGALRMHLSQTVPAVRGRGLQIQLDAQRQIAERLHEAFPDELDAVAAGALVGAFIGAVTGALQVLMAQSDMEPAEISKRLRKATAIALKPWR